jgi:hypothetical protein
MTATTPREFFDAEDRLRARSLDPATYGLTHFCEMPVCSTCGKVTPPLPNHCQNPYCDICGEL